MSKNIKALLAEQAAVNLQQHRDAEYGSDFDLGRQHIKIPLSKIAPNQFQPRLIFHEDGIRDLAESIAQIGLTQPITVRTRGDDYELIAGERRLRAHRLLNKPSIEAIVVDVDDGQAAAMALSENIDREGLTDFEIAEGIRQLEEKFPKRAHLAKALNLQRSDLYRYLSFRDLPSKVVERLRVKPDLLGRRAASEIVQALKEKPSIAVRMDEALDLLSTGKVDQGKVVNFLRRHEINDRAGKFDSSKPFYLTQGRTRVGSITRTSNGIVIKVSNLALPDQKAERLQALLLELLAEGD
jgi:ParB family transcriptional regulator, chromosome partitioning protein